MGFNSVFKGLKKNQDFDAGLLASMTSRNIRCFSFRLQYIS